MKRSVLAFAVLGALMLSGLPSPSFAVEDLADLDYDTTRYAYYDEYDDTQSHPIRIAAYLLHPVGYALEWVIFRPFHYFVSMPDVAEATGHRPHGYNVVN